VDNFTLWLRSLDPEKLARETFHHENHRKMLKEHEFQKTVLRVAPSKKYAEPENKATKSVNLSVDKAKVKRVLEPTFTEAQMRVATAALKNKEK